MLLAEIIHATGNGQGPKAALLRPSPGISDALQLLEYLGTFNNQAAIQRRDQIQRIYSHISSVHSQSPPKESPSPCRDHTHQHGELQAQSSAWDPPLTPPPVNRSAIASGSIPTGPDATGFPTLETMSEGYTAASLPIEFPDDPYAMYSLYYDRDLNLTGGDLPDFEQLQRHFFGSDPVT
ncbi:hypothetical protein N7532_001030 [Penicillium argentinense]|uniref:Uncharacterized protein n=1 Tax=Penicillium argentinense TaxID=1131581 RepID=A0A9W9G2K4_9EURO|nr:uncharacterized protein N7532_001030 [Penicillium argentinense]KAJ5110495.1 hypothetical protein N7532_001030 [Penicillium argentinense]